MLSRHVFQNIFHQFGIVNPCPDLRLVIPRVVVAPVIVFFLTDFTCAYRLLQRADQGRLSQAL